MKEAVSTINLHLPKYMHAQWFIVDTASFIYRKVLLLYYIIMCTNAQERVCRSI